MIIRSTPIKQYIKIWGGFTIISITLYFILSLINMINIFWMIEGALLILGISASLLYRYIYHHHYLKTTDKDVVHYTGILNISTINVPYHKIDNVRIRRSILSRFLGLVDIYIDTPGDSGTEIIAKDMPYSEYQIFYSELRKKMEEKKHREYP